MFPQNKLLTILVLIGLASSTATCLKLEQLLSMADNLSCDLCKMVAQYAKSAVDQGLLTNIEKELSDFCDTLDGDSKGSCHETVHGLLAQFEALFKESPENICSSLNFCYSSYREQHPIGNIMDILDSSDHAIRYTLVSTLKSQLMSGGPAECEICKTLVAQLIKQLDENPQVVPELEKGVVKVCQMINKDDANKEKECEEVAMAYVKEMIKFIKEQNPEMICSAIGQCMLADGVECPKACDICKSAFGKFKEVVLRPESVQFARNAANFVCEHFMDPKSIAQCKQGAKTFLDNYYEHIKEASPEAVCHHFNVC